MEQIDTTKVRDIIQEFLEKLTLDVEDVNYVADALHPIFSIKTQDAKKLIGVHGDNLRSLNFIVKRIVERRLGVEHPSFLIDVNHYQQDRNEEIRRKAKVLIERVRSFKTTAELEPLNAYERMLVHTMVADDPEIETESIGEGRVKTVRISYTEVASDETHLV